MQLTLDQVKHIGSHFNAEHRLSGKALLERMGEPVIHPRLISLARSLKPWGIIPELRRIAGENGRFYERRQFAEVASTGKPRNPAKNYVGTVEQLKAMIATRDAKLNMYRLEAKKAYRHNDEINRVFLKLTCEKAELQHENETLWTEVRALRERIARLAQLAPIPI